MPGIFGAIRWDVGNGYGISGADGQELWATRNPEYHGRAPWYAQVVNTNDLSVVGTQATMDAEIAFALTGGLSYWAFLRYQNRSTGLGAGALAAYQASTARGALKWVSMEQPGTFGGPSDYITQIPRLVTEMAQAHYQRVTVASVSRPLLMIYDAGDVIARFGTNAAFATAIAEIRTQSIAAGVGNPYIVWLAANLTASGLAALLTTFGCDAISAYFAGGPTVRSQTYASFDTAIRAAWAASAAVVKILPWCMSGWSPASRMERPVSWSAYRPRMGLAAVVLDATDAEMAAHFGAAGAFIAANPSACESGAALAYSWTEFNEGARPLCPTRANPTGTHLPLIAAAIA